MKINIVGWYGQNNIGDEAFRPAIETICKGHELTYVTPPSIHTNPDLVILGGGAVASPYYFKSLPTSCPRYAIGVDLAYESESDLLAAQKFNGVMFRNSTDVKYWKWKFDCPVAAMPDLSFMIRPTGARILEKFHLPKSNSKRVAVFATDYVNPAVGRVAPEFQQKSLSFAVNLGKELDVMIEKGWTVYLLCCSTGGYGDDRRMALQLKCFMNHSPIMVLDTFSPQDMVDLIAEMDLAVCMRFHAHLFSTIAGTPFVSIDYTRKVKMYLEDLGLKDTISCARFDGTNFDTSKFQAAVQAAEQKENWGVKLRHAAGQNFNKLCQVITEVRRDWLGESS